MIPSLTHTVKGTNKDTGKGFRTLEAGGKEKQAVEHRIFMAVKPPCMIL